MTLANWFFAFPFDGRFVLELPPTPPRFRRFHPDDVHLTLAFLGGCGQESANRALKALDERLSSEVFAPVEVALGEVTPMGSRRAYTALSALLERGRAQTERTIAALRDTLTDAALGRREKRDPKAHVTLARPMRHATDADRTLGLSWAAGLDLRAVTGTLSKIALYTWDERRRERLFRVVAERPLGPASSD